MNFLKFEYGHGGVLTCQIGKNPRYKKLYFDSTSLNLSHQKRHLESRQHYLDHRHPNHRCDDQR